MRDREEQLKVAVDAVRAASRICRAVREHLVRGDTLEKKDKSPVTVADFASQAVVCALLERARPDEPVVGEEDAADVRGGPAELRAAVISHAAAELGGEADERRVLGWIDRGGGEPGVRFWTLDPIDGTKGFLRGEQYAVALGLIEEGEVVLGVLGCPNLPHDGSAGALFTAVRGEGSREFPLWDATVPGREVRVTRSASLGDARFCESVESGHSNQDESAEIARLLGITREPYRIDSQCKYAVVGRGEASIYLRLPTRADYREKIWDHAAGKLVVECAGGRVSDIDGRPLDFSRGKTLDANRGVVATSGGLHDAVLDAVRRARG